MPICKWHRQFPMIMGTGCAISSTEGMTSTTQALRHVSRSHIPVPVLCSPPPPPMEPSTLPRIETNFISISIASNQIKLISRKSRKPMRCFGLCSYSVCIVPGLDSIFFRFDLEQKPSYLHTYFDSSRTASAMHSAPIGAGYLRLPNDSFGKIVNTGSVIHHLWWQWQGAIGGKRVHWWSGKLLSLWFDSCGILSGWNEFNKKIRFTF